MGIGLAWGWQGLWFVSPVAQAQESSEVRPPVTVSVASGEVAPYQPDRVGSLGVLVQNRTEQPREVLIATHFDVEPTLQFGRRVWLPPRSMLQTWQHVRLPKGEMIPGTSIGFHSLVLDPQRPDEVLIRGDAGDLKRDGLLRIFDRGAVCGLIDAWPERTPSVAELFPVRDAPSVWDLVFKAQLQSFSEPRIVLLSTRTFSASDENLQALDQLVIADPRVGDDVAGLIAIRRWMFAGGKVWLMLDRCGPVVLQRLLGDEAVCEVVDRVAHTTIQMVSTDQQERPGSPRDYEQSIEFVRTLVSGVQVAYTLEGWPAAFWKDCGEGRLLVTTLNPRGWLPSDSQPVREQPEPASDSTDTRRSASRRSTTASPPAITEEMSRLAAEFFSRRREPLVSEKDFAARVPEFIGYSIPEKWVVSGLLFGFCGLMLVTGLGLQRRGRLEILGLVGAGLAILVSGTLVLIGSQHRQAAPPTVASVQLARAIPGTDDVQVEGISGLYSPDSGVAEIASRQGGWMLPDLGGTAGTTRRLIWTDLDQWHWDHFPQAAGVRLATFRTSVTANDRLHAQATFGPDGLSGKLHVPASLQPTDPILATNIGRGNVELRQDGTFEIPAEAVFAAEQFLAAEFLSDEQHRRQELLKALLANPQRRDFPTEPQLLFWTSPWDVGFHFRADQRILGSALVAVPLRLHRPEPGTHVRLTPPWLPFRVVVGPDGTMPSPIWDFQRLQWTERSDPSVAWLRFQIPSVLAPIAIESGHVTVQVRGPVGKLEIATYRPRTDAIVRLKEWIDPVGRLTLNLTDSSSLEAFADGSVLLRVSAGDPDRPELTLTQSDIGNKINYWQIETLSLDLNVKVIAEPELASVPTTAQ